MPATTSPILYGTIRLSQSCIIDVNKRLADSTRLERKNVYRIACGLQGTCPPAWHALIVGLVLDLTATASIHPHAPSLHRFAAYTLPTRFPSWGDAPSPPIHIPLTYTLAEHCPSLIGSRSVEATAAGDYLRTSPARPLPSPNNNNFDDNKKPKGRMRTQATPLRQRDAHLQLQ